MTNDKSKDYIYSIKLSKNDIYNLSLVQKFCGHPHENTYDDDGNLITPECEYVSVNDAIAGAIAMAAQDAHDWMLEKPHRYNVTKEELDHTPVWS